MLSSIPLLDEIVLQTIERYSKIENLPHINMWDFRMPLVVWSGNGYITGKILFRSVPAFFASESEIKEKLASLPWIEEVVVISASGEKHAPIILWEAKKHNKKTCLISSNEISSGKEIADTTYVFPKFREPYTYNTSTYFGYLYGLSDRCDLVKLQHFIDDIFTPILSSIDWTAYTSFCLVIPNEFILLREMFETKFIELFGRKIARDIFSYEQMKHATTVVQDPQELFVCFDNTTGIQYGENQINLPLPQDITYASMMLIGYFMIGKIQRAFPSYFTESIEDYCIRAKAQSGFSISPIVEA
jgi:hypothetical protein